MNHQGAKRRLEEPQAEIDACARSVIGAAIEVHRHFGPGFLEAVYEEALAVELDLRGVPFKRQVSLPLLYKGRAISETRLDLVVGGGLVVELKAVEALLPIHLAQVLSYLKAGSWPLGLLINFNVTALRQGLRRVVRGPGRLGALGALAVHPSSAANTLMPSQTRYRGKM